MKKVILSIAAVAALCSCAKELNNSQEPKTYTVDMTLTVDQNATKTEFDGDSHIKWLAGDDLAVIIAPEKGAQSNVGAYKYAQFKIGTDLENPVFSGSMVWMDDPAKEQMWVYGVYPYSASSAGGQKIHGREVTLPAEQTFSATSWDGKADVMAIEPVQMTGTPGGSPSYYSWQSDLTVKFAHLFGFGCLSFGDVSTLASENIKKVTVTATNAEAAKNPLAGTFAANLEQNIITTEGAVSLASNAANTLVLKPSADVAMGDAKVWFVANPGTYDVTITVYTADHKVIFQRSGLVIERAKIAKPVLNIKDGDEIVESGINVTGKTWVHDATAAYAATGNASFFRSGATTVNWGTGSSELMEMTLSYLNTTSDPSKYYASYSSKNGKYINNLGYSGYSLNGATIAITSGEKFVGVKGVKLNAGDTKRNATGKVKVYITDAAGKHEMTGNGDITGNPDSYDGKDFYFDAGEYNNGVISIEYSNFSDNYSTPYYGAFTINPTPGVVVSESSIPCLSAAAAGEIECNVVMADSDPVVSTDADWINAEYAQGKISWSVAENTEAQTREAAIKVAATNANGTTEVIISVSQLGCQYVQYTMNITYNDIKDALIAAGAEDLAAGKISSSTYYTFDVTVKAASPAGEKEVVIACQNVLYMNSVEKETISVYGGSTYGRIVSKTPVYGITAIETSVASNQEAPAVKIGTTSSPSTSLEMKQIASEPLTFEGKASIEDLNAYFQAGASSWSYKYHDMSYVKVTFIDEVSAE